MKKHILKILSMLLVLVLISGMAAGCAKSSNNQNETTAGNAQTTNDDKAGTEAASAGQTSALPIVTEPLTLTYWTSLTSQQAVAVENMNESLAYQEMEKRTGIKINFIHPPLKQESEQFSLLIASGDLPDMIKWNWQTFPGGPEAAINSNVIIKLNDLINKYAVNYKEVLAAHPDVARLAKTDDGTNYVIAGMFSETPEGSAHLGPKDRELVYESWIGPIIRQDWLDELGLQAPATIDEWYDTLKRFKDEKKADVPFTFNMKNLQTYNSLTFVGAYDTTLGFYEDEKVVKYGPLQPGYKDFLATFSKWYKEGLLDADFPTNDGKAMDAKAQSGRSGAWLGTPGSIGTYFDNVSKTDPKFKITGLQNPTLKKGDPVKFGQKSLPYKPEDSVALTTANKHTVESIKWLDYAFSYDGDLLLNWGVEGVSFNMADGRPTFSELVTKNDPDGLTTNQAIHKYLHYIGPFMQDYGNRKEQWKIYTPSMGEAVKTWSKALNRGALPPVTIPQDKIEDMAFTANEINTYVDEMFLKFVMGIEPVENYGKFAEHLKTLGVEGVLKVYQDALDKFYQR